MELAEIESAFAAEAAAHARAAAELNPYGDAEAEELGSGLLVYSGSVSTVHGVYGLGANGEAITDREISAVERFFARKDRAPAYWVTSFTDPSLLEHIARTHKPTRSEKIHGRALEAWVEGEPFVAPGKSQPEHGAWSTIFSGKPEGDLLSLTKIHQRQTRYYAHDGEASYTFFFRGIALIPHPRALCLPLQIEEARGLRSSYVAAVNEPSLPFLYERILHEQI